MNMGKFFTYSVFIAVSLILGFQVYRLNLGAEKVQSKFDKLNSEKETLLKENEKLKQDIGYFSDPHNLEKELRARFNARNFYEKLIIIVPPKREGE